MKKLSKIIVVTLCLVIATSTFCISYGEVASTAAAPYDCENHWAKDTIIKWIGLGMASGYPDGSFKPDNFVTRAEFVKLVNEIIDFDGKGKTNYYDVLTSDWFYDNICVAQEIGYINGYSDAIFGPEDNITREQAAAVLSRIQYLKNNESCLDKFIDRRMISYWAAGEVGAASEAGFINGYDDGSFRPANYLTRAEALKMLDNVLTNAKNKVIYKAGTELSDSIIEGNLIIAKTVGDGDVHLNNIDVRGEILVYGGGINSIYFNNVKVSEIQIKKDCVRLVFSTGSIVEINAGSDIVLENSDGPIANIKFTSDSEVLLSGEFSEVLLASSRDIVLSGAVVDNLIVENPISILGTGTITSLTANADGILFDSTARIVSTVIGDGVTVAPAPTEGGAIIGGGGGGGGGAVINPVIRINVTTPESSEVFNTEDYSNEDTVYDAIVGILNDSAYSSLVNNYLTRLSTKLNNLTVDTATGVEQIWDMFEAYLPEGIDISSLRAGFIDGSITKAELNSLLDVYETASSTDLNSIITNMTSAGFDSYAFEYNGTAFTYSISNTGTSIPSSNNTEIADFILNQIMIPNKTIGDFFDEYGSVTFAAVSGASTVIITISIH